MSPTIVICCICWRAYHPTDPAIEYRSLDGRWWCRDETECTEARARAEAAIFAARDQMGQ